MTTRGWEARAHLTYLAASTPSTTSEPVMPKCMSRQRASCTSSHSCLPLRLAVFKTCGWGGVGGGGKRWWGQCSRRVRR